MAALRFRLLARRLFLRFATAPPYECEMPPVVRMETTEGEFGGNVPIRTLPRYHMMWTFALLALVFRHKFEVEELKSTATLFFHHLESKRMVPRVRRSENRE